MKHLKKFFNKRFWAKFSKVPLVSLPDWAVQIAIDTNNMIIRRR